MRSAASIIEFFEDRQNELRAANLRVGENVRIHLAIIGGTGPKKRQLMKTDSRHARSERSLSRQRPKFSAGVHPLKIRTLVSNLSSETEWKPSRFSS
ncbi:Hypothetical protein NTJ_09281 [Nesidiocoris tenuis]|uniref:UBL3-like ubiquitin domain-containing protein n=1 Tax=Nesidiocoris tenuis TaxID=355587 RepID=A0ABN7AWA8_9HEMI|nr:Hypothetical protein NTJ_09281 [Nesidiocoris tenuis]